MISMTLIFCNNSEELIREDRIQLNFAHLYKKVQQLKEIWEILTSLLFSIDSASMLICSFITKRLIVLH